VVGVESRAETDIDDNLRRRRSVMNNARGVHVQRELLEAKRAKEPKVGNIGVEEWSATIADDEGTMRESAGSGRTKEASW
jgi:hypothetical protein